MPVARRAIPEPVTGYAIGGTPGYWSAIKAEGTVNLIENPSFDVVTGGGVPVGYGVLSAPTALARVSTWQRRGLYAGEVTNAGGIYYEITLTTGQTYTFSADLKGNGGDNFDMYFADNMGGRVSGKTSFKSSGRVQRPYVTYTARATSAHWLVLERSGGPNNALTFLTDGWQLENKPYPTTYCDGDQRGYVINRLDYYWQGTPNAARSIRIAQSRAGGRVHKLGDYGFSLMGMVGLGQDGIINYLTPLANGGAYYYGSNITDRVFTLTGAIQAPRGLNQLHEYRAGLQGLFSFERVIPEQPITMRYFPYECGEFEDEYFEVLSLPENGMSGNITGEHQERVALPFHIYTPYTAKKWGDVGSELSYELSVTDANLAMKQNADGVWSGVDVDVSVFVLAVARLPNDTYVLAGEFPSAGGVANTEGICIYNPNTETFTAMGTGGAGGARVNALATDAMGNVYAVGDFPDMGGVADTKNMALWDYGSSAWVSIGSADAELHTVIVASDGIVYAGGDAMSFDGVLANRVASYDGVAWSAMSTGFATIVFSLAQSPASGQIYAAVETDGVYYWDGAAWVLIGALAGADNVFSLAFRPDGVLFATGSFTTIAGIAAIGVAYFLNGWFPIGTGLAGGIGRYAFYVAKENAMAFTGTFTSANGIETPGQSVYYIGNQFFPTDFLAPGTVRVIYSVFPDWIFVGFSGFGTATAAASNQITNTGTSPTGPRFTITGPGTLQQLKNYTTGASIIFNLEILLGETVTLDFSTASNVSFNSSFRGNLLGTIARGSNLNFALRNGVNLISLFILDGTADTTASILFTPVYSSIDDIALERRRP